MTPQRLHTLLAMPVTQVVVTGRTYSIRTHADRRRKPSLILDEADFLRLTEGLSFRRTAEGDLKLRGEDVVVPVRRSAPVTPLMGLMQQSGADGAPFLHKRHMAAADQWRNDYHAGFSAPHMTTNWAAFGAGGGSIQRRDVDTQVWRLKARSRYQNAVVALGELADLLVKVCFEDMAISAAERILRLPRRTGKERVRDGLERLVRHYGL